MPTPELTGRIWFGVESQPYKSTGGGVFVSRRPIAEKHLIERNHNLQYIGHVTDQECV